MIPSSPIAIFSPTRFQQNLNRAYSLFQNHRFLFDLWEKDLLDRVALINREFKNVLVIGSRTSDSFDNYLKLNLGVETVAYTDFPSRFLTIKEGYPLYSDEIIPFDCAQFDLIISVLTLHHINDLPGFLIQITRLLKADGVFLANMFGGETLFELRQSLLQTEIDNFGGASPRVMPFADKRQMGDLMQRARFSLPVVDSDLVHISYKVLPTLLKDIRGMAEGLTIEKRNRKFVGKSFFINAAIQYKELFAKADQTLPATFEVISLIGWRDHQSQQKPLKRGSAEHSLAEALKVKDLN